jgi:hypothetical protein
VILENHMHFILQSDNLSKDIQRLKSFTAKKIINFLQQKNIKTILEQLAFYKKSHKNQTHYQLWQEGCHPEIISSLCKIKCIWFSKITKALIFKPSFCKNFRLLKIILTVAGLVKIGIQSLIRCRKME